MVLTLLQIILGRIGVTMGYIAFINGKGVQVVMDDNGVHLEPTVIKCEVCEDDRVFRDGTCFRCHELINRD
jgi:hypothetical protein